MQVLKTVLDIQKYRVQQTESIGFVATMGGLHAGHVSLIKKSLADNAQTLVSIYVNPTQFNNPEDLKTYPIILQDDLSLCEKLGVDAVFTPSYQEIYPDDYSLKLMETDISRVLEGQQRPGHFDGMLTVVLKLFNLVRPKRAYFGEKDFQQLSLVKKMVKTFFLPIEVIGMPTIREVDGVAMSSRNKKLSQSARVKANKFPRILNEIGEDQDIAAKLVRAGFEVEYVETKWNRRLAAINIESVRLIDNVEI